MCLLKAAAAMGLEYYTLIYTLLSSGGRPDEVINLLASEIDSYMGCLYMEGKTDLRRRPLVDGLKETLDMYFNTHYYRTLSKKSEEDYVFFSMDKADGSSLNNSELNKIINKVAIKAGINQRITAYWFRVSFANLLYFNGVHKTKVQQLMDHDKIETTEIYLVPKKGDSVFNMLEESSG